MLSVERRRWEPVSCQVGGMLVTVTSTIQARHTLQWYFVPCHGRWVQRAAGLWCPEFYAPKQKSYERITCLLLPFCLSLLCALLGRAAARLVTVEPAATYKSTEHLRHQPACVFAAWMELASEEVFLRRTFALNENNVSDCCHTVTTA